METNEYELEGSQELLYVKRWSGDTRSHVVLLAHGYAEHIGRYEHVAEALADDGAVVYGPDHLGHGRSGGERALVTDFRDVVADLHQVRELARREQPDLPVVLVGHSMGGLIATLYAEAHPDELEGLVLSGPVIGDWAAVDQLLALDEIPDQPLDESTLSRDPEVGRTYANDPLVYRGAFHRATLQALRTGIAQSNERPDLVSMPVLHLHGEQDALVPMGPAVDAVERFGGPVEQHLYDGARHEVFNETNRDEVLGHVRTFVRRVTAPSAG